jgi:Carboxypeptidase regulatory-like domain
MKRALRLGVSLSFVQQLALLILFLASLLPPAVRAQVSKGSISGAITDPQGQVVPDANVKAVSKDTNQGFSATTDSAGLFKISLLPVGAYRLEIGKNGFRNTVIDNVQVNVGEDRGMGLIKLELGEVTATVEVSAAPPLIENTEAQITNSFTTSDIGTFPTVLGNEGLDLLALTVPGVTMSRDLGFSNSNGVDFAVNGLRGRNNDQQIDGQNNNDNSVAGPSLFVSDTEFVQEYQITTSNFGAEYGRNSGSVVNIVTKSGTNTVHGSVYGSESNAALDSLSNIQKQFEGLTKVPWFNDEFVGGTIGGPLWVNHVFF